MTSNKSRYYILLLLSPCCIASENSITCEVLPPESELTINKITIDSGDIFDESNPKENNWLFRSANYLHINSKKQTIINDLLFKTQDPYSERLIHQSERRLRSRKYLNNVNIETKHNCDGTVDIIIHAREVWTFKPTFNFSRAGNNNNTAIGIEDTNFLGSGNSLSLSRTSDADRTYSVFQFDDPNTGFLNSSLYLNYSSNSDGFTHALQWQKPFESLEAQWATGISLNRYEAMDFLYDSGNTADQYLRGSRFFEIYYGRLAKLQEHSAHRWLLGSTHVDNTFDPDIDTVDINNIPTNNEYYYPWIEYHYRQEHYIQTTNFRQINRLEDVNLGWNFKLRLGYTSSEIDDLSGLYAFGAHLSKTESINSKMILQYQWDAGGFYDNQQLINFKTSNAIALHWKNLDSGQFYVNFEEAKIINPLNNDYLTLGGENGLRGFPANYQVGDHSQLINIEQRFYGQQEIFSLFYLGAALFFDGGHVWGDSPIAISQNSWLRDVGFGLRLSNTRMGGRLNGGYNVIHIDMAFPIDADIEVDSLQFLVKVKSSF